MTYFFISIITNDLNVLHYFMQLFNHQCYLLKRLKYVMINKQTISLAHCGLKKKKKGSCFGLFHYFRWWCKHDYYRCKPHFFPQLKTVLGHCVIVLRCTILQYLSIIANQGRIYCSTYTNVAVIWCRTRHRISSVLGPWLDRQVVSCVMKHSPWLT